MPHRAGYFVLAYHWDHHCRDLTESLKSRFARLVDDLNALALPEKTTAKAVLRHYSAWQSCRQRFDEHLYELGRRCTVIQELNYRGYGTNKDLLGALETLRREHSAQAEPLFHQAFEKGLPHLPNRLSVAKQVFVSRDVSTLLAALRPLARQAEPAPAVDATKQAFDRYFRIMSQTPWVVNTSIFQKLFLQMGTASMTIMQGRTGLASPRPAKELKVIGNRNFMDMYRESFASLHHFSQIDLDFLKHIHWVLSKGLDPDAGNFRRIDFPDRNGVTTEFGNLHREIGNLAHVLWETGQSFHDLPQFIWNLTRSYYMFIGIHPFWDSNGRVGRTLLNHMLLKKGIPPIAYRDADEVFALPRYGGSMEDMQAYLTGRILRAMENYLREREQLESRKLFEKEIYNVSFDSGFYFRQINENPQKLQISVNAYLSADDQPLSRQLVDQCRLVLPDEKHIRELSLYCGLTDTERGEWKETLGLQKPQSVEEVHTEIPGVRTFEINYEIEQTKGFAEHDYLCCSAVSPDDNRVFSNKGVYYCTRIEKRAYAGLVLSQAAERYAVPAFKWLNGRRSIPAIPHGQVAHNPGGVGFSFLGGAGGMSLKTLLEFWRADGICEQYLVDTYRVGDWGGDWQKWQTHRLPLLPWDGPHGHVTFANFAYILHRDSQAFVSKRSYKFGTFADFTNGSVERTDFFDPAFQGENHYTVGRVDQAELQAAYNRVNRSRQRIDMRVVFTRGNPHSPDHPVNEVHRAIDQVIDKKRKDKKGRHWIHLAIFDMDNYHVAEHLIFAKKNGVDVECLGDWAALSALNRTENIAKLRRAGIPVVGIVRNTPGVPDEGIGSMHTKFIVFDGQVVHSSSYNLHFHLWGGNREEVMVYQSPEVALMHENIFQAIRGGVIQPVEIDPAAKFNLYYSFGCTRTEKGKVYRAQDAIITEINNARSSIWLCMFDIGYLKGVSINDDHETDVVSALVNARNRGVKVRVLLNGQIAHCGPLPAVWDKDFKRPLKDAPRRLKEAWIEVGFVYYHESIYSPLHHKYAVIDQKTCLIGSYNWYEASTVSDEVMTVIRDEALARTLADDFQQIAKSFRIARE